MQLLKPVFLLSAWAAWFLGGMTSFSWDVNANESSPVKPEVIETSRLPPVSARATRDLTDSRNHLKKAVQRALQGLQGEPLHVFINNQSDWEEIFTAETGVDSKFSNSDLTKRPQPGSVEMQYAIKLIKRRSSWIHGLMDHQKQGSDGWTGFWSDNQGGWMSLVDRGGVIYFSASCIRGEDHYLGSVSGKALKTAGRAIFKNTPVPGEEVLITFTIEGPWLRVEGTNTGVYHGLKAYFDGDYAKIAPLPPAKQKEVISASKEP